MKIPSILIILFSASCFCAEQLATLKSFESSTVSILTPDEVRFSQQVPVHRDGTGPMYGSPSRTITYVPLRNWLTGEMLGIGFRYAFEDNGDHIETIYDTAEGTFTYPAPGPNGGGADQEYPAWLAAQTVAPNYALTAALVDAPLTGGIVSKLTNAGILGTRPVVASFPAPTVSFTPSAGFVGDAVVVVRFNDVNSVEVFRTNITFRVTNTPPTVASGASPQSAAAGTVIMLTATATDLDGHSLTYSWDFGDGNTGVGASPSHTYAAPGVYTATVTVNDGFATTTSSVIVDVAGVDRVPTARYTTTDVVGFEGVPFGFDAFYSTDPQNKITGYSWDFGDGSPIGSGQLISKIFSAPGTYVVKLIVQDAEGLLNSTQRLIEILPADQIGLFNAFVEFKTTFDRSKTAKDSLTLKARLNVGDSQIGDGSAVALEVAEQRFAATLDRKFRAAVKIAPKQTWKVQFATRKQSAGQVDVQVTIKNANLGLGFNQLGAVAGGDGSASITVPVRLEVGAYSYEIPCDTDFEFNNAGTKAKGEGASE